MCFALQQVRGQLARTQDLGSPVDHRALNHVLQFAYISGPGISLERIVELGKHTHDANAMPIRKLRYETLSELPDIDSALSQRGHVELQHVQTVVQVRAEATRLHQR